MSIPLEPSSSIASTPAYVPIKYDPPADPKAAAKRVMDTGDRAFLVDNYEARMIALSQELSKGDATYREELMKEIFKEDPGALHSWLTPGRVNLLTQQGHISQTERSQIAEAFASAYNNGYMSTRDPVPNINSGSGQFKYEALDDLVWEPGSASGPGARADKAQHIKEFLDLMNSSQGPEAALLRENYSRHLINEYVINPKAAGTDQQNVAAVLATNLLGGSDKAADVLASLNGDDQIQTLLTAASKGIDTLAIKNANISYNGHVLQNVDVPDGAAALLNKLATIHSTKADTNPDTVAASLARLPGQNPEIFKGELGKARADAMGNLFVNHSDAILTRYSQFDDTHVGADKNPSLLQYGVNAAELAALFRTVMFNKDARYSAQAQNQILAYAEKLKAAINNAPNGDKEASQRLSMLSAATSDAVTQGWNEIKQDKAGKKEMIGFLVDLAFTALPTDKLNGKVSTYLADLLSPNDAAKAKALEARFKPIEGSLFDAATGKITENGKEALYSQLGGDANTLINQDHAASLLRAAFTTGLTDNSKLQVEGFNQTILANLNLWRSEGGVPG
jgi:hypothetical protein